MKDKVYSDQNVTKALITCQFGAFFNSRDTFRALSLACSSSSAACFSRSSTLVKDIPVLASDETAFDRVLALQEREIHTEHNPNGAVIDLRTVHTTSEIF